MLVCPSGVGNALIQSVGLSESEHQDCEAIKQTHLVTRMGSTVLIRFRHLNIEFNQSRTEITMNFLIGAC
jgi:hypothetical protein